MSILPSYESIIKEGLPLYNDAVSYYRIDIKFSFNLLNNMKLIILDKQTNKVIYKLYQHERGFELKRMDSTNIVDLLEVPRTNQLSFLFYINNGVSATMEYVDLDQTYKIQLQDLRLYTSKYFIISKLKFNNLAMFHITEQGYDLVLIKGVLAFSSKRLLEIAVFKQLEEIEFEVIFLAITRCAVCSWITT
ncbi:hypothetical protein K502DRAFT_323693 [Neoconidiobolus thromboides FSU 785]|nr:hypothetical protein K502DRAFT_323693 [Neoconidiobolus thromboides FSU 785]